MLQIAWDNRTSQQLPRIGIQVFSIRPGQRVPMRLLGPPSGVWTHWVGPSGPGGRSRPHCEGTCPWCTGESPRLRWYAAAERYRQEQDEWIPIVAELTCATPEQLGQLKRGTCLLMGKVGKRIDSQVSLDIVEQRGEDKVSPQFDVKPILMRMWGFYKQPEQATWTNPQPTFCGKTEVAEFVEKSEQSAEKQAPKILPMVEPKYGRKGFSPLPRRKKSS